MNVHQHHAAVVHHHAEAVTAASTADDSVDLAIGLGVFVFIGVLYLLPTIIAIRRKSPHVVRIALINIFLGWTVHGWIAALVSALKTPQAAATATTAKATPAKSVVAKTATAKPLRPAKPGSSNPFAFERDCPNCASRIPMLAPVCPVCGYDLYAQVPSR